MSLIVFGLMYSLEKYTLKRVFWGDLNNIKNGAWFVWGYIKITDTSFRYQIDVCFLSFLYRIDALKIYFS